MAYCIVPGNYHLACTDGASATVYGIGITLNETAATRNLRLDHANLIGTKYIKSTAWTPFANHYIETDVAMPMKEGDVARVHMATTTGWDRAEIKFMMRKRKDFFPVEEI